MPKYVGSEKTREENSFFNLSKETENLSNSTEVADLKPTDKAAKEAILQGLEDFSFLDVAPDDSVIDDDGEVLALGKIPGIVTEKELEKSVNEDDSSDEDKLSTPVDFGKDPEKTKKSKSKSKKSSKTTKVASTEELEDSQAALEHGQSFQDLVEVFKQELDVSREFTKKLHDDVVEKVNNLVSKTDQAFLTLEKELKSMLSDHFEKQSELLASFTRNSNVQLEGISEKLSKLEVERPIPISVSTPSPSDEVSDESEESEVTENSEVEEAPELPPETSEDFDWGIPEEVQGHVLKWVASLKKDMVAEEFAKAVVAHCSKHDVDLSVTNLVGYLNFKGLIQENGKLKGN